MSATVTRGKQTIPVTTASQSADTISGTGNSNVDGTEAVVVSALDPNNPATPFKFADDNTLQQILTLANGAGLNVVIGRSSTGTPSSVAASTSTQTLLAAATTRLGATVVNESSANLYLLYGSGASTTAYTVKLTPGAFFSLDTPIYTGIITGVWDAATGNARITQFTP